VKGLDFGPPKDEQDLFIDYLIEEGGLVLDGISEDGETIYLYNMEVLERLAPEFAKAHMESIADDVIDLYRRGHVTMEISDEGEVYYNAVDPQGGVQFPAIQTETLD
jgi:hypothetical protein